MPKGFKKNGEKLGFRKGHKLNIGKNNPNYKHGKYIENKCKICGKLISPKAKICKYCNLETLSKLGYNRNWKAGYYKEVWMRSSYERAYAKHLDKNNIKWKYEPRVFKLKNKSYKPDFYLQKEKIYVEIKGWMTFEALEKIKEFKKIYKDLKLLILEKKDLEKLGVL